MIYWSKTGNTEKVGLAIKEGLEDAGVKVVMKQIEESEDVNYLDYDLVCIGSPTYQWHPPPLVVEFLKKKHNQYCDEGKIRLAAPKISGKYALVFCTFSGPHTGINEAIPTAKYISQFLEHLGFAILDEWYILSEYHGWKQGNIEGKMGDIRGKPSKEDLLKIKKDAANITRQIK